MRNDTLYREEIVCLIALVENAIAGNFASSREGFMALGSLHLKLSAIILEAPSLEAPSQWDS